MKRITTEDTESTEKNLLRNLPVSPGGGRGGLLKRFFSVSSVLSVVFFSSVALAQDYDDPDLARALAGRGWFDLAEEICERISKNSSASRENKAVGSFVMAEILLQKAERESDPEKAKKLMNDSVALLQGFLKDNPDHPLAGDARTNIGFLQTRKARLLLDAVESEVDSARLAEMKKEILRTYAESERYYQDLIAEFKKKRDKESNKDKIEIIDNSIMDARLELCKAQVEHAKVPGVDAGDKAKILKEAVKFLIDFEFDYGDRPIAFEGMLEEGKALMEMGSLKEAEAKLRGVLALKQRLKEANIVPNEYHLRILYNASISLAQTLIRASRPPDAVQFIDQVFKENQGLEKHWAGLALKLEKADALFQIKKGAEATALIKEVEKVDPNGPFGAKARALMARWSSGGGGLKLSPEQLIQAGDGHMEGDRHRQALMSYRKAIEACASEADRAKFEASAWFKIGQVLQVMKRNYEAAFAYTVVFERFPASEQAAKACYEAVRCYNAEHALSGDKRDEELKEKYLDVLARKWPKDPAARNILFVQAEKIEQTRDYKAAAEKFLQVPDNAEAYDAALIRGGYCYSTDAFQKWSKAKTEEEKKKIASEVKNEFSQAETALQKFLERPVPPPDSEAAKNRPNLVFLANQRIAEIYMHEAVGKTEACLKFLEQCAKNLPPDDGRLGKIWALQVQAHLARKELDPAVSILEMMSQKFPDGRAIAQASKSVAIRLHEATEEMIKNKGDQDVITQNLKKISKYYAKWLNEGPASGLPITIQDVLSVAETLYMIAKRINGLDDSVVSFLDLKGKVVTERPYFDDAAFVHTLLVEGKVSGSKLPADARAKLMSRLARCYSFGAATQGDWERAKEQYDAIVKDFKMVTASGALDVQVLTQRRELLRVYVELGYAYYNLGRKGQKFQLDNAETVFVNVTGVTEKESETWWLSRYIVPEIKVERGGDRDVRDAQLIIDNVEKNYPDFDGGKYGMKEKFLELKKKVDKILGGSGR